MHVKVSALQRGDKGGLKRKRARLLVDGVKIGYVSEGRMHGKGHVVQNYALRRFAPESIQTTLRTDTNTPLPPTPSIFSHAHKPSFSLSLSLCIMR